MQEMVHTEHWKITMLKIYSTLSFRYDCGVISHVDSNGCADLQISERVSFIHHVIWSFRIYQNSFGLRSACHESMTSFTMWFPILMISPPKIFMEILMWLFLKKRSSFIKFIFHAGMLRVEALTAVRTLNFFFSMMQFFFVLLRTKRLFMLLVFQL